MTRLLLAVLFALVVAALASLARAGDLPMASDAAPFATDAVSR